VDGQKQRQALSAVEQALRALIDDDGDRARRGAQRAVELDQVGAFDGLEGLVAIAAGDIEATGAVTVASWQSLAEALGPGPLGALAAAQAG
jgi:hypothetical protein